MSETKVIKETARQRIYRTSKGAAVSCSLQYQATYDDYDGQQPGWYGWCGLVDDQSDYVLGPYESADEVFAAYEKRNRTHARVASVTLFRSSGPQFTLGPYKNSDDVDPSQESQSLIARCIACFTPHPRKWPNGVRRLHCDRCLDSSPKLHSRPRLRLVR